MRKSAYIVFMGCLMVLLGCGSQDDSAKAKQAVTAGEVKKETKQAAEAAKEYTLQQKEEYQKKLEAQLKEMHQKIDEFAAKTAKAATDAKAKLQEQTDALHKKWEATEKKFKEMQKTGGKAWEELKSGTDAALDDLKKSYDDALSHFK